MEAMEAIKIDSNDDFPWNLGIFDAHCHPTDTMSSVSAVSKMNARALTIMATRAEDQNLVDEVGSNLGINSADYQTWNENSKIIPSFGWHPWFSYQLFDDTMYKRKSKLDDNEKVQHYQSVLTPKPKNKAFLLALPDPRPLSAFIQETKDRLNRHPLALVGEIGLDKSFRLPDTWIQEEHHDRNESLTPGGREGRRLSPYHVDMDHQRRVLKAQLHLAGELRRAVSVHGVQAHGIIFDTLQETWSGYENIVLSKRERRRQQAPGDAHIEGEDGNEKQIDKLSKPFPPRVCMHSYSGPVEAIKQYLHPAVPAEVYFSFSTVVNFSTTGRSKSEDVVKALPDDRILVESDIHMAGEKMDHLLEDIVRKICAIKEWELTRGVQQLRENYLRFALGNSQE